jgi:hypothetical protein
MTLEQLIAGQLLGVIYRLGEAAPASDRGTV